MSVKIIKRSGFIWNFSLFIILTPIYLHIVESLEQGRSAVSLESLLSFSINNKYLLLSVLVCLFTSMKVKQASRYVCGIYLLYITVVSFSSFIRGFDKIILLLNMSFASISYTFYLFLLDELKASFYTPGFSQFLIGDRGGLPVEAKLVDNDGVVHNCRITNWDEVGCYVSLESKDVELRGRYVLNVEYFSQKYVQLCQVVTSYGGGFGLRFLQAKTSDAEVHDWSQFYSIISDRGYRPAITGKLI